MIYLNSLNKALNSLNRAIDAACSTEKMEKLDQAQRDTIRAGVIQNFEFTYELCWKIMKRWLEENIGSQYVDGVPRAELFRLAAESHLIIDVTRWMNYHKSRNLTSHTYNEEYAEQIFQVTLEFYHDALRLLESLEEKNDRYKS